MVNVTWLLATQAARCSAVMWTHWVLRGGGEGGSALHLIHFTWLTSITETWQYGTDQLTDQKSVQDDRGSVQNTLQRTLHHECIHHQWWLLSANHAYALAELQAGRDLQHPIKQYTTSQALWEIEQGSPAIADKTMRCFHKRHSLSKNSEDFTCNP